MFKLSFFHFFFAQKIASELNSNTGTEETEFVTLIGIHTHNDEALNS